MSVRISILAVCIVICSATALHAQQRNGRAERAPMIDPSRDILRRGETVFAETVVLPADTSDRLMVSVMLRVAWDFVVFTRTTSLHPDSLFDAGLDVTIDLRDAGGGTVQSQTDRVRVATGDYDATNRRDRFISLVRSFPVTPGMWTIAVQLDDRTSARTRQLTLPVAVAAPSVSSPRILSVLPLENVPLSPTAPMTAFGFGGSMPFSTTTGIAVTATAGDDVRWQWTLERTFPDAASDTMLHATIAPLLICNALGGSSAAGVVERFAYTPLRHPTLRTFVFVLPADTIDAGFYSLRLVATGGGVHDTLVQPLRVLWRDMPLSLRDPDLAAIVMRHVLTEEEISELDRLDGPEKEHWIREWWGKRDPDVRTRFNEYMTEYFRRADVAYYRFQMLGVPNGAITDRGKVYMLYGEPDDVRRSLAAAGQTEEVWIYTSLGKTFHFTDTQRNGNLKLTRQSNDL